MRILATLLVLLSPALAAAQEVKVPERVEVPAGRLAAVTVQWSGDDFRYAADPGLDVFREYHPDPQVVRLRVIGYAPGEASIHCVACKGGRLSEFATCRVVVGGGGPIPNPGPGPNPGPNPNPPAKAWLVVIEETREATAERGAWLSNPEIAAYLKAKGWRHRVADRDVLDPQGKPPADLAPYLERAKGKSLPQVYLVDQDGVVRIDGPLPATPAELVALLRKVGG